MAVKAQRLETKFCGGELAPLDTMYKRPILLTGSFLWHIHDCFMRYVRSASLLKTSLLKYEVVLETYCWYYCILFMKKVYLFFSMFSDNLFVVNRSPNFSIWYRDGSKKNLCYLQTMQDLKYLTLFRDHWCILEIIKIQVSSLVVLRMLHFQSLLMLL